MLKHKKWIGVPCPKGCVMNNRFPYFISKYDSIDENGNSLMSTRDYKIGQDTPDE